MNKLILGGLGISKDDLSIKLKKRAKEVDKIYCELYTSQIPDVDVGYLENLFDRKVKRVERSTLEENFKEILEEGSDSVLILVPGDPLVFTTHLSMIMEAKNRDIETKVIHAPSIYSAIGETGLFLYNFGKATTIPFIEKGYRPRSPYETIKLNKQNDLHTLVLLDIKNEREEYMNPSQGLKYLLDLEDEMGGGVVSEKDKVIVVSQLGSDSKIKYGKIEELIKEDYKTPGAIVFPGKLNNVEKEFLETF